MNREHKLPEEIAALLLLAALCLPMSVRAQSAPADARSILETVYKQDGSHDTTFRADFETFDKDGHGSKKKFLYRELAASGIRKTLVVFTDPEEIRGVALLSINQMGNQTGATGRQYLYTPAIDRVRSVAPRERSERFIGSDFTYEDITEHVLDDFTYRLLSDGETIDNHKTYKVQATPVDPQRSQYKFIYYWVAQDVPVILHAEMYDAQGKEVRVLHASQIKQVSGIWGTRRTEMRTVQDGTRTVLTIDQVKFNSRLPEKLFDPESLAKDH